MFYYSCETMPCWKVGGWAVQVVDEFVVSGWFSAFSIIVVFCQIGFVPMSREKDDGQRGH